MVRKADKSSAGGNAHQRAVANQQAKGSTYIPESTLAPHQPARNWGAVLTYWGTFCGWVGVGYAMSDRLPHIASLFYLAAFVQLAIGFWLKAHWKRNQKIITAIVGIAAFGIFEYYWMAHIPAPFFVSTGPVIAGTTPQDTGFLCLANGSTTAYPANLAISVNIVNGNASTVITDVALQIRTPRWSWLPFISRWIELKRVDTIGCRMADTFAPPGMGYLIDGGKFLDRELSGKTLHPYDSASGWLMFAYPTDVHDTRCARMRITVFDSQRNAAKAKVNDADTRNSMQGGEFPVGGLIDLRQYTIRPQRGP